MLGMFLLSFASATDTYQVNTDVDIKITCLNNGYCSSASYCNINVMDPIGNLTVDGQNMTYQTSYHNYTINATELGTYDVTGFCLDGTDSERVDYTFDVTLNGNPTPENMPIFLSGLVLLIFVTACFFLYLSSIMNETAFKIFFLLASVVFLMASFLTTYMVLSDGNVASSISTTTLSLFWVLGMISIILFIYFLIRQTVNALDLYNIKRGHAWEVPSGSRVAGYNTKRAY